MRLWRISQYPGLTGIGGTMVDGRWHSKPAYVVYAAEHPALAMVEVLATLRVTATTLPVKLRLFAIDVKKGAKAAPTLDLPSGWQANQPTTQALGNAWLAARQALLLKTPSAIVTDASNFLINPLHRQAATHLTETDKGPFWVDPRFIR